MIWGYPHLGKHPCIEYILGMIIIHLCDPMKQRFQLPS